MALAAFRSAGFNMLNIRQKVLLATTWQGLSFWENKSVVIVVSNICCSSVLGSKPLITDNFSSMLKPRLLHYNLHRLYNCISVIQLASAILI